MFLVLVSICKISVIFQTNQNRRTSSNVNFIPQRQCYCCCICCCCCYWILFAVVVGGSTDLGDTPSRVHMSSCTICPLFPIGAIDTGDPLLLSLCCFCNMIADRACLLTIWNNPVDNFESESRASKSGKIGGVRFSGEQNWQNMCDNGVN